MVLSINGMHLKIHTVHSHTAKQKRHFCWFFLTCSSMCFFVTTSDGLLVSGLLLFCALFPANVTSSGSVSPTSPDSLFLGLCCVKLLVQADPFPEWGDAHFRLPHSLPVRFYHRWMMRGRAERQERGLSRAHLHQLPPAYWGVYRWAAVPPPPPGWPSGVSIGCISPESTLGDERIIRQSTGYEIT